MARTAAHPTEPKKFPYREVEPMAGAAPYFGGKHNLAGLIVRQIEAIPHLCYAESFSGMASVCFRRRRAPKVEVLNDLSRDVASFFRVLQRHYQAFFDMLRWQLTTRADFERLKSTDPATLTDLERAARFYYLQRTSFGAKLITRAFRVSAITPVLFDITRLAAHLDELHARLAGVAIESLDFGEFVERYDRPTTLFYLDPPYYGLEREYSAQARFTRDDFGRLAKTLERIAGRFILSLNDRPEVRSIFRAFKQRRIRVTYSLNREKQFPELIITGGIGVDSPAQK